MDHATAKAPCAICALHADDNRLSNDLIWRGKRWLLRHHPLPAPLVGWCLLDAERHLGGALEFNAEEAASWGPMVQQASQLVKSLSGCDRVYAIAFGEGARHLHLHLIPRHGTDQRTAAWSVADLYRQVELGEQPAASADQVAAFIAAAREAATATWA